MKTVRRQKIRRGIIFFMFLMFPVFLNYLSPYLIIYGASKGIVSGSFIIFCVLFLAALFFGRSFCGWICPAAGMQEGMEKHRTKKAKTGAGNIIRWIIWIIWLSMIVVFFIKAGGIKEANFLFQSERFVSILEPHIVFIYLGVVLIVYIMNMIWGQRAFCKYLCWMAPFMIIGDKIRRLIKLPGLYLKEDKDSCIKCGRCSKECPMDIDVEAMVQNNNMYSSECIQCLNCIDVCPKGSISIKRKV